MIDIRPILFITGFLLIALSGAMSLPALLDLYYGDPNWILFACSSLFTFFCGGALALAFNTSLLTLSTNQALAFTAFSWVFVTTFSALPLYASPYVQSYTDAFFEAMSGITTTGSTILVGLEMLPKGLLLWRGLLQWIGGIGIIVVAVAILPILQIGGMQLFRAESSDRSDKVMPRISQVATGIGLVYVGLTAFCFLGLWWAGLSIFDALIHSMATVSTGGMSGYDASFAYFNNPVAEWLIVLFMVLSGLPLVLYIKFFKESHRSMTGDSQVQWYISIICLACTFMFLFRTVNAPEITDLETLRHTVFNTISALTCTGFVTADYTQWGPFPALMMFFLMFIGGCTGSATGGIKIFRIKVLTSSILVHLRRILYPSGIFVVYFNKRPVPDTVSRSVEVFFYIYILCFIACALMLSFFGHDFITSLSGSLAALSNVGQGLGDVIGPTGNFSSLSMGGKWTLSFTMLLGRLELLTVLVLFLPKFWRP